MGGIRGGDKKCKQSFNLNTWRRIPIGRQLHREEENFRLNVKETKQAELLFAACFILVSCLGYTSTLKMEGA
jgi:hypothetical protein